MGIYNTFKYNDGTLYGNQTKLENSAEPFSAVALFHDRQSGVVYPRVQLNWGTPKGTINGFRIVRNQEGYPEHEEDGLTVYETYSNVGTGTPTFTAIFDSDATGTLHLGRHVYYAIWILLADNTWHLSAKTSTLIPKPHDVVTPDKQVLITSEEKFLNLLPRAFTTLQGSNLDELNRDSDLALFLNGFAFTLDELLTHADLVIDSKSGLDVNPNLVSVMAQHLGLPLLSELSQKTQKRLIRQAVYLYQHKGTELGLQTFVESLTGYAPTISTLKNEMLSAQDSSFYRAIGNWQVDSGVTLTAESDIAINSIEKNAVDKLWCGKAVVSGTGKALSLGNVDPVLTAIPVIEGTTYYLAWYASASSSVTIQATLTWYDTNGASLSTSVEGSAHTLTSDWQLLTFSADAPAGAAFVGLTFTTSGSATYYLDMIQLSATNWGYFNEARGVQVDLAPSKINFLENPSFAPLSGPEVEIVVSGATDTYPSPTTVPGVIDNSHMLQLEVNSGSTSYSFVIHTDENYPIPEKDYYTFSIYGQTDVGTQQVELTLQAYDFTTSLPIDGVVSTKTVALTTDWSRPYVSLFIPEFTATDIQLVATVTSLGTLSAGDLARFDAAQVERGYVPSQYFDGDYVSEGASWANLRDESFSLLYADKKTKLDYLFTNIAEFLPVNTPYLVTTGYSDTRVVEGFGFSS